MIPKNITAGFSVEFSVTATQYPTAVYNGSALIRSLDTTTALLIGATEEGLTGYKFNLTPAQTATLAAGNYSLTIFFSDAVTSGALERVIYSQTSVKVTPNPESATDDIRSFNQIMVDRLESALLKLASGTTDSVTVNGKSYNMRNMADIRKELAMFRDALRIETTGTAVQKQYIKFIAP